jgi:hypothetical protein
MRQAWRIRRGPQSENAVIGYRTRGVISISSLKKVDQEHRAGRDQKDGEHHLHLKITQPAQPSVVRLHDSSPRDKTDAKVGRSNVDIKASLEFTQPVTDMYFWSSEMRTTLSR